MEFERTSSLSPREGRELSSGEGESFVDFAIHPERFCVSPSPLDNSRLSRGESKVLRERTPKT